MVTKLSHFSDFLMTIVKLKLNLRNKDLGYGLVSLKVWCQGQFTNGLTFCICL